MSLLGDNSHQQDPVETVVGGIGGGGATTTSTTKPFLCKRRRRRSTRSCGFSSSSSSLSVLFYAVAVLNVMTIIMTLTLSIPSLSKMMMMIPMAADAFSLQRTRRPAVVSCTRRSHGTYHHHYHSEPLSSSSTLRVNPERQPTNLFALSKSKLETEERTTIDLVTKTSSSSDKDDIGNDDDNNEKETRQTALSTTTTTTDDDDDDDDDSPPVMVVESSCMDAQSMLQQDDNMTTGNNNNTSLFSPKSIVFGLLWITACLSALDRIAMSVALVPMAEEFMYTDTMKGSISSLLSVGYGLTILPAGLVVAAVSPRLCIMVGIAVWSLATMATPVVAASITDVLWPLLLARALVGAGESIVLPTTQRFLTVWALPEEKSRCKCHIYVKILPCLCFLDDIMM